MDDAAWPVHSLAEEPLTLHVPVDGVQEGLVANTETVGTDGRAASLAADHGDEALRPALRSGSDAVVREPPGEAARRA